MKKIMMLILIIAFAAMSCSAFSAAEVNVENRILEHELQKYIDRDDKKVSSTDDLKISYFYEFDDGTVLFIISDLVYDHAAMTDYQRVGDYTFEYTAFPFQVYHQGTICYLEQAYVAGFITDPMIEELAEKESFIEKKGTQAAIKATNDESAPTTASASNAGPAVKTGESVTVTFILLMLLSAGAILFLRRKAN